MPALEASQVIFPEGDRLMRVTIGSSTETSLEVQSDALGKLSIPLEGILGIDLRRRESRPTSSILSGSESAPNRARPKWSGWPTATGLPEGSSAWMKARSRSRWRASPRSSIAPGVVALGFDPKLVSYPRPTSDFLELTLKDGSRLGVTEARLDDGMVLATTRFGAAIKFSLERAGARARQKFVDRVSFRAQGGPRPVSFLSGPDPRISHRSHGRWPYLSSGRPDLRPRARHAKHDLSGVSGRTGRSPLSGASWGSTSGPGRWAASSFACSSTARNDSRPLP